MHMHTDVKLDNENMWMPLSRHAAEAGIIGMY